jgi:hypothetical protein
MGRCDYLIVFKSLLDGYQNDGLKHEANEIGRVSRRAGAFSIVYVSLGLKKCD